MLQSTTKTKYLSKNVNFKSKLKIFKFKIFMLESNIFR